MTARSRTAGRAILAIGLVFLCTAMNGQPSSSSASASTSKRTRRRYENEVARLFETTRGAARLQPLTRISYGNSLEQLVCTAALRDHAIWRVNSPARLMYRTANPSQLTTELKQIAEYQPMAGENAPDRDTRYAVAVWPTTDKTTGQQAFWVGVELRPRAWIEFIDRNLTDNRPYRNDWQSLVAPECRTLH